MRPLLADPELRPRPSHLDAAHAAALDLLRIRTSTPLFRLGEAELVQQKVSFPAAEPGVVAMHLDDTAGADVDPALDGVLVVFNATPSATTVHGVGDGWRLHEVHVEGADEVVRRTRAAEGAVTVPGRTTAVLVR